MDKLHPIIRWIIFIPASLLAGWASYYVLMLAHYMKNFGELAYYFHHLTAAGLSGAVFIYIGFYIAPSFKKRVVIAYVLLTLISIPLTFFTTPILEEGIVENLRFSAQTIGILFMGWYLYREEENA